MIGKDLTQWIDWCVEVECRRQAAEREMLISAAAALQRTDRRGRLHFVEQSGVPGVAIDEIEWSY
jgi:hypothetical protein